MFGQPRHQNAADGEARQPLLNDSQENPADKRVVFAVDDSDDDEERSAIDTPKKSSRSVTFREDVQVIGPPLRSTIESREAGV
jgi:solute carrier family 38 (sodium-coupled neutral amino acid transporter), member 11